MLLSEFRERDIVRMTIFLVTSIDLTGATVTARHFLPTAAETEKLRRALAGHTGIAMQEGAPRMDPSSCTKRSPIKPPPAREGE